MSVTPPLAHLIETFQKLPGVGPKSAQRLAFHVLKQPKEFAYAFAEAMTHARDAVVTCQVCYNLSGQSPCEVCVSANRNRHLLCVVCDPRDLFALERTREFQGLYHVLGGLISPLDGVGPDDLRIAELLDRLQHPESALLPPTHIDEVILALPPSTEGDTTSLYLARQLKPFNVRVTRIAFGLPVGGDLDYADSLTITRAIQGRQLV
jgi:recombination protein RecR